MSFINISEVLTEAQIEGVRAAATEFGIAVNNFDWFIDGFQSTIQNDGTNEVITLGELAELQQIRLDEGQTTINPQSVKKLLTKGAHQYPLLAGSKTKTGFSVQHFPLFDPVVIGSVLNSDERTVVSGGHRTETFQALVSILTEGDATAMYMQETNIRVVHRVYPDRASMAIAVLMANGSRTPKATEKNAVATIAKYGINVNDVEELRAKIEAREIKPQDWIHRIAADERTFINRATGEQLKEETLKKIFSRVYTLLSKEQFSLKQADEQGNETDNEVGTYTLIKDLLIGGVHSYRFTDEQFALWQDYDVNANIWRFNDTTKQYDWVIPMQMTAIVNIMAEELTGILATTSHTNIAYNSGEIAEEVANRVVDRVMMNEALSQYALPPKPQVKTKAKRSSTTRAAK